MNRLRFAIVFSVLMFAAGDVALAEDKFQTDALMVVGDRRITADQWGLDRIGLDMALRRQLTSDESRSRILVAVIDSGVDDGHPDFRKDTLWLNSDELLNGIDDDGKGYVDDRYGWDFIDNDNNPWDELGHGTHVAGIIAAATGNGIGISGVDDKAVIMPLRALNLMGRGYSSRVAAAIYYATDNGAAIINLSMAVQAMSPQGQRAVSYAVTKGVLVVAAAGNEGSNADEYTPGSLAGVLTVAAADRDGDRAAFSNFGASVDLTAPGVDIVSLRALNTDFASQLTGQTSTPSPMVGPRSDYYRASGTSFAAPFVSGTAALLKSRNVDLDGAALARILMNSAVDIGTPGIDNNTGFGMLQVPAALAADPAAFIECRIRRVQVVMEGAEPFIEVLGTAAADALQVAELSVGEGDSTTRFGRPVFVIEESRSAGVLGRFSARAVAGAPQWTLRLWVQRRGGYARECRFQLNLGG